MKKLTTLTVLVAVAAPAAVAPAASAREFEGTVVAINRDARTFSLRDEGRTVRIKVTSRTRYERLAGFSALRRGMTGIEAIARRADGRWVASLVERSGRDGGGGGDDDR
ncbi:MAG TPA: hypothetical protein VGW10_14005 [Solirubrobacteraceae bacterium]|nr:hypothetical protein [Solirubrobacteraceae bacterium]